MLSPHLDMNANRLKKLDDIVFPRNKRTIGATRKEIDNMEQFIKKLEGVNG